MTTYHDIVATDQLTGLATPTEWQGQLHDGRHFYFRYRWGQATLGIGDTPDEAITDYRGAEILYGSEYAGELDDDTYQTLFVQLYVQHPAGGAP